MVEYMSQVQVPSSNPNQDFFEITYRTWGSFGQYIHEIAVLRNNAIVDPEKLFVKNVKGSRAVHNVQGVEVIIENHDSRKNDRRTAKIPASEVIAIIRFTKTSGNFYEEVIYGGGQVMHEVEVKEETSDRYKFTKTIDKTYYADGERKILLSEKVVDVKKELIAKPRVIVSKTQNKAWFEGDTYHVKEILKKYKCRFDPLAKAWHLNDLSRLNELIQELEQASEVIIQ